MKFIDLFAGLGGFHVALKELGHECVFASEINESLRKLYFRNHDIEPKGDIRDIIKTDLNIIPKHDILCAGFPCQPFSKAGKQEGMNDEDRGTLFDEIAKILEHRKPKYFILENVPHLKKHDNEKTWLSISKRLQKLEYTIDHREYSPHQFGIPQHRNRVFIIGCQKGLTHFEWPVPTQEGPTNVQTILEPNPMESKSVGAAEIECLRIWQEQFIDVIPITTALPSFPIWSMEFGATYPFEKGCPHKMTSTELGNYRGMFGVSLHGLQKKEQMKLLPSYARTKKVFPSWKRRYIRQNRQFYSNNQDRLQQFVQTIRAYTSQSWQKLEWNVQDGERTITNYILQFRASGIRIKKADFFPSLVCTNTQIPIIGWELRYITKTEGARLQSMEGLLYLPENHSACFEALGNAVSVSIVKDIARRLIMPKKRKKKKKAVVKTLNRQRAAIAVAV